MSAATEKNPILAAWEKTLAHSADKAAIFSSDGEVLRRFAEIEDEAQSFQNELSSFQPRSVIGLQLGNSVHWPAILLGCFRSRLIPLPLGRHIEKGERKLALKTCVAVAVIELHDDQVHVEPLTADAAPDAALANCDFLKLTSGTTATPRAIRFRAAQLLADCENICDTMGITSADRNFGVIPFSHSYGFSNLMLPLICRSVPLVTSEDRVPRAILDGLARSQATVFPGMPVFYQAFTNMNNQPELPHLRLCISAGAPLQQSVATNFMEKFGRKIHTFYGASECGGISYDGSEVLSSEEGFVGTPMKNVMISLSQDSPGQLEVRSDAVGDGYFPEQRDASLAQGRFVPSDFVQSNALGLSLAGRLSDTINVAGKKLNPFEIEFQIRQFPGVKEAIVFAAPSPLRNEEPIACIAANGGFDISRLRDFCRNKLSAWQMPKDFWIVEKIPVNERGKISRRDLARLYAER